MGLEENGATVIPIGVELPAAVHYAVALAARSTGKTGASYDRIWIRQVSRLWALGNAIRKAGSLDLILAMGTELYDLEALRRFGIPIVTYDDGTLKQMWSHHSSDLRQNGFSGKEVNLWIKRQARSSRAADINFVSTNWAKESFMNDYSVVSSKVRVVGMGHRPKISGSMQRDWSLPRYLFVGVDWKRKNGDRVLQAFREVRKTCPEAVLDIVGDTPDITEAGVSNHGLISRTDDSGQRKIQDLLSTATCFTVPSLFDPSPIAYLEAGSAGLPVVGTKEGGAQELLGAGSICVDPTDTNAITQGMLELARPDLAELTGKYAREAAATSTWVDVARKILEPSSSLLDIRKLGV